MNDINFNSHLINKMYALEILGFMLPRPLS
jgi:hypothetical protein